MTLSYPAKTARYTVGYHGTNREAAQAILREGFRAGTYFAESLDAALRFGGEYLFAVVFDGDRLDGSSDPEDRWQWWTWGAILPDRILWAGRLARIYENGEWLRILNEALTPCPTP